MKSNKPSVSRIAVFFAVVVVLIGAGLLWWRESNAPVNSADPTPVLFVVAKGEGVKVIAANLVEKNLIRSPISFYLGVKLLGIERQLQAGDFRLSRTMNTETIARELTHGMLDVWVTTLEGWRIEEIATKLARELDIPEAEFLRVAAEGYMFPDTYFIPRDATAGAVAAILRKTFQEKVTDKMREDAKITGLTWNEVVTLASIVEREGRTDDDRPVIAGILLKRLRADWPLQADATLQYALGYQPFEKSWWKKSLTSEDKNVRSPYNTYRNRGLPPGPIANPGLASIKAVIYPSETDYWYYLHDRQGKAHYARTIEEHERNVATYLQ
ncbi:endolytic transglycosylase MltG [Candidatus Gottesmanbacteria bacterium]|nr:endolytic transglycosylase MltG [Candidatus Gottesmanbacteria bacterium]